MAGEVKWTEEIKLSASASGGLLAIDLLGDTVKNFLGKFIPAEWVDPATEFVIGAVLIYLGHTWAGPTWREYVVMAGRAGIALAIRNIVKPYITKLRGGGGG